jgi:hypothetical protein
VEAFLGLTRGFDVPAGAVVLLGSASYAALVGAADYCAEFVRAAGQLRGAFSGGINTLHGIPFLLGGTRYAPAIRTLAEIEHFFFPLYVLFRFFYIKREHCSTGT